MENSRDEEKELEEFLQKIGGSEISEELHGKLIDALQSDNFEQRVIEIRETYRGTPFYEVIVEETDIMLHLRRLARYQNP